MCFDVVIPSIGQGRQLVIANFALVASVFQMLLSEVNDKLADDWKVPVTSTALMALASNLSSVHVLLVLLQGQPCVHLLLRWTLWTQLTSQIAWGVCCFPVHFQDGVGCEHFSAVKALVPPGFLDAICVVNKHVLVQKLLGTRFENTQVATECVKLTVPVEAVFKCCYGLNFML